MRHNFQLFCYGIMMHLVCGNWTDWEEWTPCLVAGGSAFVSRKRNCSEEQPESSISNLCRGNATETKSCILSDRVIEDKQPLTPYSLGIAFGIGVPVTLMIICVAGYIKQNGQSIHVPVATNLEQHHTAVITVLSSEGVSSTSIAKSGRTSRT